MRILNQSDVEISNPDLQKGRLEQQQIFKMHHDAVPAIEKRSHYDVLTTYPNGGQDLLEVIDVEPCAAKPAWDEYEDILRYIEYTAEELAAHNAPTQNERIAALEAAMLALMG